LAEGQLERTQPIAQRASMHVTDLRCAGGDQAREGVDELASLVEIELTVGVIRETGLDCCGAHQVHRCRGDHLDGGYIRDVACGSRCRSLLLLPPRVAL